MRRITRRDFLNGMALAIGAGVAGDATMDMRTRLRAARAVLYAMPFEVFEQRARDELTRMLGPGGFDADKDIAAITVNRWGHGYSYSANSLFDPDVDPGPDALARVPVGRIAIANSDAAWDPYAHAAIGEAHRAVRDLLDPPAKG
jgi:spermidine dehydrogenase